MKITVKGTIQKIQEREKKVSKENLSGSIITQKFILKEENEDYNNILCFDCWKEKCRLLDDLMEGCRVSVEFFFKSAESYGKWYTNMYVVNIKKLRGSFKTNDVPTDDTDADAEIEPEPTIRRTKEKFTPPSPRKGNADYADIEGF